MKAIQEKHTITAKRGVLIVEEEFVSRNGERFYDGSRHEWKGDGFRMTAVTRGEKWEEIPDSRSYVELFGLRQYKMLSIKQMLDSGVPRSAMKMALRR